MRTARFYFWIAVSLFAILLVTLGINARGQAPLDPVLSTALAHDDDSARPVKDEESIRKSFPLPAGERSLEIDNVTGYIEVTGGQSDQVQLVVNKTIRAEDQGKLEKARKEVSLDITQDQGALKLYVNGPFRCQHRSDDCVHSDGREGYEVRMDFQVQVPHNIALKLNTVNGGHVQVKNVAGNYSVHNVNGGIEMADIAGSGNARTVNGGVKVVFSENPRENSNFASVNGSIDLEFVRNLSADFRLKTLNGDMFTDFPMTALSARAAEGESHDGRFVFHADRFTGGRVGAGGPEIKAESINGSIRIMERHD